MDSGGAMRSEILRKEAERHFLEPLRMHGWIAEIERASASGEFLIVSAKRGDATHRIAFLYSASTSNATYKLLAQQVEHIYHQHEANNLEQFTRGVEVPVSPARAFGAQLIEWNRETSDGKFSPSNDEEVHSGTKRPRYLRIQSEEPLAAIWLRLRQLQSVKLAEKLVAARAEDVGMALSRSVTEQKAGGIAFALRNASDYFTGRDVRNISQRVLNFYYGSLSFAFAEMLANPQGPSTLGEIEKSTAQGHGLYTIDGASDGLEHIVVGAISNGFFSAWLNAVGAAIPSFSPSKARKFADLEAQPADSWFTIEQLFASIPEVGDLFVNIFDSKPRWVTPVLDQMANLELRGMGQKLLDRSYVKLIDDSARLTAEDIAMFPGPISEITAVKSEQAGRQFRVGVDHPGHQFWWGALKIHHSPFERNALILPIFGVVDEFRMICTVLLYVLSIIVRYRPSIWRRVQEGDLDHVRALIEAFLAVVERVLPEQFLASISGQPVSVHQPGSFFS